MTALPDRFEIRTDRSAVYRRVKRSLQWEFVLVMLAAGLTVGGATALFATLGPGAWFVGIMGFSVGVMVVILLVPWMLASPVMWLLRREMPVPLVADAQGVWMAVPGTAEGFVRLPWWAVRSVTTRGRGGGKAVVVRMRREVPQAAPGVEGVTDAMTASAARRGIVVSTVGTSATARETHAALDRYAREAHEAGLRPPGPPAGPALS